MMAQILFDQAIAHHQQGRLAQAQRLYSQLLQIDPGHLDGRHMLGVIHAQQGRPAEASVLLAAVVRDDPDNVLAWENYARTLGELGAADQALSCIERALALAPANARNWNTRSDLLQRQARWAEALESAERASQLDADFIPALENRATGLQRLGRYDEALALYDRLIGADDAATWSNRGICLQNMGAFAQARASFERALEIDPGLADARMNLGLHYLTAGDFRQGLALFEWRKRLAAPMEARSYPQPLWTGQESLAGRTLFAYIEQGLGDTIQFYRFAALAQQRGARVILSVHDSLLRLLRGAHMPCELIGWGQVPPQFDYHIPLMSLPLALGMTVATIPATHRYLAAEVDRVAAWRERLGQTGLRIGVAYAGNSAVPGAEGKAFAPAMLKELSQIAGVRLINLQKGGAHDVDFALECFDGMDAAGAFVDTAAIMENLDLVISADSAPAHLAGALGVPCWTALKFVPDWRWLLNRSDTPWYPAMTLFRQQAQGDWGSVFGPMATALRAGALSAPAR